MDKLLSVPGLGEVLTVDLMDNMLSWLGLDEGGFLFLHIFLNQLLPSVRTAQTPCLPSCVFWGFAEEADWVLLISRPFFQSRCGIGFLAACYGGHGPNVGG